MPYPASVFGPAVRNQVFRTIALLALIPAALFLSACGGSSSSSTTKTGVAPIFTSTAPTALAREGVQYTYDITAKTTDSSTVTYTVASGPKEATISSSSTSTDANGNTVSSATLTWTPTHAESRTTNTFSIKATTSNNGTASQSFSITPNGNIDGTAVDHAVTGTGLQNYTQDLSGSVVEALLPNGKGGYNTIKGSGDSSGNLTVPNLPTGSFWLHVQQPFFGQMHDNYIWTNASDVDAGALLPGRPDAVAGTGVMISTNVDLTVTPTTGDSILWSSTDAQAWGTGYPATVTNPLVATFGQYGNLIDSSKGDRAFLVHYTPGSTGLAYAVEAKEYDDVTQTNGSTTTLTGTMSAVGGSTTNPVIKITQFDAHYAGLVNTSTVVRYFILEDVGYGGTEGGGTGVPMIYGYLNSVSADTDFGSIPYGIISKSGVPYYGFSDYGDRTVTSGGTTLHFPVGASITSNAVPTSSAAIVPILSEPKNVTIDGKDFLSDQTNVSLTPVVAWNPPATGVPTSYELTVYDMSAPLTSQHHFFTNGNSVIFPTGILQAGGNYAFYLQAMLSQSTTFTAAPFRTGTSQAVTSIGSGLMSTVAASSAKRMASSTAQKQYRVIPSSVGPRVERIK